MTKTFVYSGKVLLGIPDYKKKERETHGLIKNMGRKSKLAHGWIVPAPGTEWKIFADDPVSELKDVGDLSTKTLNECGITTVKDLLDNWEKRRL